VRGKGNGSNTGHGNNKAKLTFDARDLLEDCEDWEWMRDVRLEKVAICRMGAKVNGDGEENMRLKGRWICHEAGVEKRYLRGWTLC